MSTAPTAGPPSGITDWTREHRLAVFFGLTFLALLVAVALLPRSGLAPTAFFPCGPLVAALIVVGVTEGARATGTGVPGCCGGGSAGSGGWSRSAPRWRCWPLASAANVAIWGAPAPVLTALPWSSIALFAALRLVNPLDGPFGEEPGWRGYALPELQVRRSPLAAGLVLAPIVALWHLPLVTTGQLAAVGIPITFAITLVYVWLFNRTGGSVLLTIVFHIAQGTFSYGVLGFAGADAARMDWLVGVLWFAHRPRGDRLRPGGVAGGAALGLGRSHRALTVVASRRVGPFSGAGPAPARLSSPAADDHAEGR